MDNEKLKSNLLSANHWMRLVFMILFSVILYVAGIVMSILVVVQFVFALITGKDNPNLRQLGDSLSQFIYAALRFLTYNTDEKPFPFADWPQPSPIEETPEEDKPEEEKPAAVVEDVNSSEADSDKEAADK
ncbi:DUF4389 domain-containing protein [Gilvimarinus sp. SDUM040013]|uniref:DUF4389 domain-containing protein n=1 Tax=Gilvimarinus gilvus TaxID=3058038 RepID=A0ABU4RXX7_9GAMM|nr:DUF4389 domain-containing protein [Gilvimarinus sp. SDUM040013]MDO3386461.1 DUF4389 domain-containing protein [Gilvimarinus sp. SDUM040013]MDX6849727.1 DUF4389 domain-containing protein [Gilvimarinus sp. SDUM040013]